MTDAITDGTRAAFLEIMRREKLLFRLSKINGNCDTWRRALDEFLQSAESEEEQAELDILEDMVWQFALFVMAKKAGQDIEELRGEHA